MKNIKFEDEKAFEIEENDELELSAQKKNTRCCCWVGTWNNPLMTDLEFEEFLIGLENDGRLKYAVFQREKGEQSGIEHFQFFVDFKSPIRFTTVKEVLPYGCHFKPMYSTKTRCQAYCSKPDTRISETYYEIGEFVEERQRTDLGKAIKMIDDGFSFEDVEETFPNQSLQYSRQLQARYWSNLKKKFLNSFRNIEITFIYGEPGLEKSTYVYRQVKKISDVFSVPDYGEYWFTGYMGQDVVLFDEFDSQKPITFMNKVLDRLPLELNVKGSKVCACYTKVFIISNKPLKDLYKKAQEESPALYKAFCRRINKILHFVDIGKFVIERDSEWGDIPLERLEFNGLTREVKRVFEYTSGVPKIIFDREKAIQEEMVLVPVPGENLPW